MILCLTDLACHPNARIDPGVVHPDTTAPPLALGQCEHATLTPGQIPADQTGSPSVSATYLIGPLFPPGQWTLYFTYQTAFGTFFGSTSNASVIAGKLGS